MKKIILFCLFFKICGLLYAQQGKKFFIKTTNLNKLPVVTHSYSGARVGQSATGDKALDLVINSYEIYKVERVFKNATRVSLYNVYQVECNSLDLMDDLEKNFKAHYSLLESAEVESLSTCLPDDFGTTGGYIDSQEELNFIRAPEAWCITDGDDGGIEIIIGISDLDVQPLHEDLKVNVVSGTNDPNSNSDGQHGSKVSSVAAAKTDNTLGMSAIGYNASMYNAVDNYVVGVDELSLMEGVKVINTAWISSSMPEVYNMVVEDRGIVVVASAGNANSSNYIYPAAFKNVISVSSVAHQDRTWVDSFGTSLQTFLNGHEYIKNEQTIRSHQHNDSVDIVAPGIDVLVAKPVDGIGLSNYARDYGTSFASPVVSGTIALMFDVNYCLGPKEVETILKLTAVKIDTLPQNLQFYGKLGAGKLDAYEAVKMAKDMADEFGTVEVKDRILYRPWFYKLETAPYEIKMTNNDVSAGAKVKFRARNNIEILSGDYYPSAGGYIDLQIDSNLILEDCDIPTPSSRMSSNNNDEKESDLVDKILVYPTVVINKINFEDKLDLKKNRIHSIKIYNLYGIQVFEKTDIISNKFTLNLDRLNNGLFVVKIFDEFGNTLQVQKILKK